MKTRTQDTDRGARAARLVAPARDLVPTQYRIDPAASALLLPVTG